MLSTCNSACVGALTLTLTTQCDTYQRSEVPVRLIIATCDTAFPSGTYDDTLHAAAFEALITAGQISATFELTDFNWGDPTTTKKNFLSKARPAKTITVGRQLTAKDYTATDVDAAGAASPYEDRLFYKNVVQNKGAKVRGYVTESGRVYLFLDEKNEFCGYDINFWIGYDQEVEGKSIEFKNYMIEFVGDPLKNITTPYLDIIGAGAQSTLGWLYQAN
jgi:hypothetical protein